MKKSYQVVRRFATDGRQKLARFLAKEGQLCLLPVLDLIEAGEVVVDQVIDVVGRAAVEAILVMSAEKVAGPWQQGKAKKGDVIYWYGRQPGRIALKERQVRVYKPRLRRKSPRDGEPAEVAIPAYDAMQKNAPLADRMLSILMNGVSTRRYQEVLPEMAEQVGISRSQVSRETIEAGERVLKTLAERDFSKLDVLILYIDGMQFGDFHEFCGGGRGRNGAQASAGIARGGGRERRGRQSPVGGFGAAGREAHTATVVRDRWIAGSAQGDRPGVWPPQPGATLPQAQGACRAGPPAEAAARAGEGDAAGGVASGTQGGDGKDRAVRLLVGAGVAFGCGQCAGRAGGDVHDQPSEPSWHSASLLSEHEPERRDALGSASKDPACEQLAGCIHGLALGRGSLRGDGETLPPDPRLRAPLGTQSRVRRAR